MLVAYVGFGSNPAVRTSRGQVCLTFSTGHHRRRRILRCRARFRHSSRSVFAVGAPLASSFVFSRTEIMVHRQRLLVLRPSTMVRSKRPLIGIALGSGVGRGWAHLGVLNGLAASGLTPDIICGTSIGALVGGACVGGRMAELEGWARGLTKGRMSRLFDFQLGASGVIAGRRVTQILHPDLQSLAIEKLDRPFVAVATDLSTGHEVSLRGGN